MVRAAGIELKTTLNPRKLLIVLNEKKGQKHRIRPSEVHAGYTVDRSYQPLVPNKPQKHYLIGPFSFVLRQTRLHGPVFGSNRTQIGLNF